MTAEVIPASTWAGQWLCGLRVLGVSTATDGGEKEVMISSGFFQDVGYICLLYI